MARSARKEATSRGRQGLQLGRIVAVDGESRVRVILEGEPEPVVARVATAADERRLRRAIQKAELAIIGFDGAGTKRPILLGLSAAPSVPAQPVSGPPRVIEADVDGRRLRIKAKDEIVFECGKASITLRRNGKVIIRGTHVETNSDGVNRVKGGQVQIN